MTTNRDIYQEVTDRIITSLDKGVVPWHQPWKNLGGPRNLRSGKPYRGINVFLLGLSALEGGYTDPRWGTYKAITEGGGQVRKGEKGTHIILWKPIPKRDAEPDENGNRPTILLLRDYVVFNVEQADGIELLVGEELAEHERIDRADELVQEYLEGPGPAFTYGGDRAYYSLLADSVTIPPLGLFEGAPEHYSTLYHELVHSTGHETRLKRIKPALFGSDPYAKEELVAEMGAAMLCGLVGIDTTQENSAAYIAGWLKALADDRKLVVQAAAQAQKAADLIVGETFETSAENDSALAPAVTT